MKEIRGGYSMRINPGSFVDVLIVRMRRGLALGTCSSPVDSTDFRQLGHRQTWEL